MHKATFRRKIEYKLKDIFSKEGGSNYYESVLVEKTTFGHTSVTRLNVDIIALLARESLIEQLRLLVTL